ncbi:serine/threonine-protein kinase BLUS1-like [Cucumis melo var. makuwa]|uniref:Serine/threonine-protein kinase BLUS1-like n=2 Tax=Cucumis melo TaxID=3656 RepID=A0A5D3C8A9_CUCMM|nr:serine/threonine-protein kinase BLUS1-like [Cucumis melo var. makuwa]TYK08207.1 serine/threonine-protein kinase BLUS1-like [Cucumis melo var. makuwa]
MPFPTTSDQYTILTQIGASPNSAVYLAKCDSQDSSTSSTVTVAIKIIETPQIIFDTNLLNTSLTLIDHPNIVRPHCCFFADDNRLWIVMPYMSAGPLQSVLSHSFPRGMPDQFTSILLSQVLQALVYLHRMGFVHKAIKPSNIFFDSQGTVKLSVFDLMISADNKIDRDSSIPYWVPPDDEYSFKSDIWEVGVLAMEVTWGGPPIIDPRILESQVLNISRRFPYELKTETGRRNSGDRRIFGDAVKEFVKTCLLKDRLERPTAASLLDHPFVVKGENANNFLFKSIPKGVIEIDRRFQLEKERIIGIMNNDEGLKNQSEKITKISGWVYNDFLFELEPDGESLGKRVRFGGETIREFEKEEEEEEEGESSTKVDDTPSLLEIIEKNLMSGGDGSGESSKKKKKKKKIVDQESLVKMLTSVLGNIDAQREMVSMLINHVGYLSEKQSEMSNEIKRLETELKAEKEQYFQLELEYEFLKLKVPDSDDDQKEYPSSSSSSEQINTM